MAESPRTARSQKPESPPGVILPDWYHSIDSREARGGSGFTYFPRTGPIFSAFVHGPTLPPLAPLGGSWPLKPQVKTCVFTQNGPQDQLHLSGETESPISSNTSCLPFSVLGFRKAETNRKGGWEGSREDQDQGHCHQCATVDPRLLHQCSMHAFTWLGRSYVLLLSRRPGSLEAFPHSGQQSVAAKKWPAGNYH